MTGAELLGFGISVTLTIVIAMYVSQMRLSLSLKRLVYMGLGLRVVGSILRYRILFDFYGGSGDARRYYNRGLEYAERFLQFDFSPFYDSMLWYRGEWTGTSFMSFPSGIVLSGIGESLLGEFVVFSLLAFLGLVGFVIAFKRSYPDTPVARYARWIFLFPSLWYWPSSVGKDALILMGIGLVIWGYVGKRGRMSWPLMAVGTFFVFAIRPEVAAVLLFCLVVGHWLSLGGRWTTRKTVQGALILAAGLVGIWFSMNYMGVGGFDIDGVQNYMVQTSQAADTDGSTVGNVQVGVSGIPIALVNILARPFPWEATNIMALVAALEIMGMWLLVWYRRKNFMRALRTWRSHRLLRIAVPFIVVYSVTLGMVVVNLGIIARQRLFIFPFLFLLLEAGSPHRKRRRRRFRRPAAHSPGYARSGRLGGGVRR